jgi:hypothetical protein
MPYQHHIITSGNLETFLGAPLWNRFRESDQLDFPEFSERSLKDMT